MKLPDPVTVGKISVEQALAERRSVREYRESALDLADISQLLWSAYGITDPKGLHTAPSARELYPLRIYLIAERVDSLESGLYRYDPVNHQLAQLIQKSLVVELYGTTFEQTAVQQASAVIVFTGDYTQPYKEFGDAGSRFVDMDLGHAAENLHLQAVTLEIGTVVIAAFRPAEAKALLDLPNHEEPLYLMPLGKPV